MSIKIIKVPRKYEPYKSSFDPIDFIFYYRQKHLISYAENDAILYVSSAALIPEYRSIWYGRNSYISKYPDYICEVFKEIYKDIGQRAYEAAQFTTGTRIMAAIKFLNIPDDDVVVVKIGQVNPGYMYIGKDSYIYFKNYREEIVETDINIIPNIWVILGLRCVDYNELWLSMYYIKDDLTKTYTVNLYNVCPADKAYIHAVGCSIDGKAKILAEIDWIVATTI